MFFRRVQIRNQLAKLPQGWDPSANDRFAQNDALLPVPQTSCHLAGSEALSEAISTAMTALSNAQILEIWFVHVLWFIVWPYGPIGQGCTILLPLNLSLVVWGAEEHKVRRIAAATIRWFQKLRSCTWRIVIAHSSPLVMLFQGSGVRYFLKHIPLVR